ncbi:MAG: hypothetical protein AAF711_20340 [Planctomycetota bacterium]
MKYFRESWQIAGSTVFSSLCAFTCWASPLVIDDFTQGPLDLMVLVNSNDSSDQAGLNVLGGLRETHVRNSDSSSSTLAIVTPSDDAMGGLTFTATPLTAGFYSSAGFSLQYDGNPNGSLSNGQLGNVDLTEGENDRLKVRFSSEPEVGSFSFLIADAANDQGFIKVNFDGSLVYEILYSDIIAEFSTEPADYSDVIAFSFWVDISGDFDVPQVVGLRYIRAVPEPGSASLLSAFGFGVLCGRRSRLLV